VGAYPEYKGSGVDWVGELPAHWDVKRFKHLFRIKKEIAGKLGFDVLSITQRGIRVKDVESGEGQVASDYSKYQMVKAGDFAMNHMDLLTGFVDLSCQDGVTSPDYRVFALEDRASSKPYYLYLLQLCYAAKIFYPLGQGAAHVGRWRLPAEAFNDFQAPRPPLAEQLAIAKFLDRETARIDNLIAEKQNFINLLKEKRQALISHVVTKGLDPKVKMKDSGIEWMGEIPTHWVKCSVWMRFELGRGRVISHEEIAENMGDYPVYSSQTSNNGVMGCLNTFDFEGDYLTWTTDGANAGTVFERHGRFNCTNVCGTLKPRFEDEDITYYRHAIDNAAKWYVRYDINPKLMNGVMSSIKIPVPPLEERRAIAAHINMHAAPIDKIFAEISYSISLLKEHRTALISAAVTGKIDVREPQ
jgi:type I restriction enzyme S subunit